MYSLGVLISEMDTCEVPYANLTDLIPDVGAMDFQTIKTRIAMLVVAGDLKPSFTSACPQNVLDIAMQCLSYDPERRPHIQQVWEWLKQVKLVLDAN